MIFAAIDGSHWFFMITLSMLSIFMVLLILVQRGRGGGLTGALGGMGGQSAFGTKAGDLFTRITIICAAIWVLLSMASLKMLNNYASTGGLGIERSTVKTNDAALSPNVATPSDSSASDKASSDKPADDAVPKGDAPAATSPGPSESDTSAKSTEPAKP